jgi:hypothetical protein
MTISSAPLGHIASVNIYEAGKVLLRLLNGSVAQPAAKPKPAPAPAKRPVGILSGPTETHPGAELIHSGDLPGDLWFAGPGGNQARPYPERTGDTKPRGVQMRHRGVVDRQGTLTRIGAQPAATSCGAKSGGSCGCGCRS